MFCPNCKAEQVITSNSRPTSHGTQTWRRKKCLKCSFIFTTHERIDLTHITIIKKSGKRERFSRTKLYSGLYRALVGGKRIEKGDARDIAEKLTAKLEEQILLSKKKEYSTDEMTDLSLEMMKGRFEGAYLRYLAYFKIDPMRVLKKNYKVGF